MSDEKKSVEEKARSAIIQNALMRWEGVLLFASGFIASFLTYTFNAQLPIPNFAWVIVGLIGYLAVVYSSLSDSKSNEQLVEKVLEEKFVAPKIDNLQLRQKIAEGLEYRKKIEEQIKLQKDSALRIQLQGVADQFNEWLKEIYSLADRIDEYQKQRPYLEKNFLSAKNRLDKLQKDLARTTDPRVRKDLEETISNVNRQLQTIRDLDSTIKRAELRLDNTLTSMATIYPQTLLIDAKEVDNSRFRRLQQDISEEVNQLSDLLGAMDDVYADKDSFSADK